MLTLAYKKGNRGDDFTISRDDFKLFEHDANINLATNEIVELTYV